MEYRHLFARPVFSEISVYKDIDDKIWMDIFFPSLWKISISFELSYRLFLTVKL